jgi:hypothetical protein
MSTPFSSVYNKFLFKVSTYKLMEIPKENREYILRNYLDSACAEYQTELKVNITDTDEVNKCFNNTLNPIEIDILAEAMVVEWLNPIIYDDELLQNRLNTRDFTEYSTANLIEKIQAVYDTARKNIRLRVNEYTFKYTDLSEKTKGHKVVYL